MGLSQLKSKIVFLDTAPLIYFIEGNTAYQSALSRLFASHDQGDFTFITSALTLLEVLVQPIRMKQLALVDQYKEILTGASGLNIIEVNVDIAQRAAALRASYNLKTPDAIQLATALEYRANYFLTNDIRLKTVKDIKIITPEEL